MSILQLTGSRFAICLMAVFALGGACKRSETPARPSSETRSESSSSSSLSNRPQQEHGALKNETKHQTNPPARTPTAADEQPRNDAAVAQGKPLNLMGIRFTVPDGWKREETGDAGPMGPKAVFRLEGADGDAGEANVRITHFPGMKGMDRQNIARWLSQVKTAQGTPIKPEDAKIEVQESGAIRLTTVDATGLISSDMSSAPDEQNIQRMIAAIVDHPQGPHFVKTAGPVDTILRWEESIHTFLRSATVTP